MNLSLSITWFLQSCKRPMKKRISAAFNATIQKHTKTIFIQLTKYTKHFRFELYFREKFSQILFATEPPNTSF